MIDLEAEKEAFLAHYGVKGMKWGRRRGQSSSSEKPRLTEEQKELYKSRAKKIAVGALVAGIIVASSVAAYEGKKLYDVKSALGVRGVGARYLKDMPEETMKRGQEFIRRSYDKETSIMTRSYAMVGDRATDFQRIFGDKELKFETLRDVKFAGGKAQTEAIKNLGLGNFNKLNSIKSANEKTILAKRYLEKYGDQVAAGRFIDDSIGSWFKGPEASKYLDYLKEAGYSGIQDPNHMDKPAKILFDSAAFLIKPQNY